MLKYEPRPHRGGARIALLFLELPGLARVALDDHRPGHVDDGVLGLVRRDAEHGLHLGVVVVGPEPEARVHVVLDVRVEEPGEVGGDRGDLDPREAVAVLSEVLRQDLNLKRKKQRDYG